MIKPMTSAGIAAKRKIAKIQDHVPDTVTLGIESKRLKVT